ncbi:MAG: class B sortase [Oscillospiraceae bacterium]|nr:class B sortase [Oscillospiraceae bacterium]
MSSKSNKKTRIITTAVLIIIMLSVLILVVNQDQIPNPGNIVLNNNETQPQISQSRTTEEIHINIIEIENDPDYSNKISEITAGPEEPIEESTIPSTTNPPVKVKREYQDKFDRLRAKYNNDDIIGIVKIPDTVVYYPVAYYDQYTEYYLERNLYKTLSAAGSICLDYENSVERHDPNTVIYGHQMYSNSMFHTLSYYMDEDFFNNHRYIIYNTIYEDNVWEVFAYFKTHISFNYIKIFFRSEREFLNLAAEMKERSIYDTGIEIKEGDRILTLSTCTNQESDTRYVLSARMIKNKDEIPEEIAAQMANAADDFN